MTEAWRNIDWDEIDASYAYGTHTDDSGQVKDQLKAALFNEFEKVLQMHHDRVQAAGLKGTMTATATMDIAAKLEDYLIISGSTPISAFSAADAGTRRSLEFLSNISIINSANLILPAGLDMYVLAGSVVHFRCTDGTKWRCTGIQRADGMPQGRRGVADGSADNGVLDIDSDNTLATAGDLLYRGANNGSARWGIDFDGHEWVSNMGNGGVGTLERALRLFFRPELISTYDFYGGVDILMDGFTHDYNSGGGGSDQRLDCSSIIPVGSGIGYFEMQCTSSTNAGMYFIISGEEDMSANVTYNKLTATNPQVNVYGNGHGAITLPSDGSRKLSYFCRAEMTNVRLTCLGWGK